MIEYGPITVEQFRTQAQVLLTEHYAELTRDKTVMTLSPNWKRYFELEQKGTLFTLGAWDGVDLVGYVAFFLGHHMHYQTTLIATNDVLFLSQDYRKGSTGVRLIKESEKQLAVLGVKKIFWHVKHATVLGPLLKALRYDDEEYVMAKLLGE